MARGSREKTSRVFCREEEISRTEAFEFDGSARERTEETMREQKIKNIAILAIGGGE